jgi:four helix bundle protein
VRRNTEFDMKLRIVDELIEMVGRVHRLARVVGRRDRNLAEQMRDAATGVGTNAGEGLWGKGGNRTVRLESAMTSGREVIFALRIAGSAGYLEPEVVARQADEVDRVVAILHKLTYPRR